MRGKRTEKPRITVAYCRVSTTEQAVEGHSLDVQRARLEALATVGERQPIREWFVDDGCSASSLDRPEVQRLLMAIRRREVGAVLVTKLDRLTRRLRDLLDIVDLCEKTGTVLVSATESIDTATNAGRAFLGMLGIFAEFELGEIRERTRVVNEHLRRNRHVYGFVPFGWTRDGDRLVENAEQQATLTGMRAMHAEGMSLRAIADALNAKGTRPSRGDRWHASSVRSVLTNKIASEVA